MLKFIRGREYVIDGSPGWIYKGDEYYIEEIDAYFFFNDGKDNCWCYYIEGFELGDVHELEEEN